MEVKDSYGRPTNICNTPKIATIELHHNKYGTGEFFTTSITHTGHKDDGFWEDGLLNKKELETIIGILMKSRRRLNRKLKEDASDE